MRPDRTRSSPSTEIWLPWAALAAISALAFLPALGGEILYWDDRKYLADSAIQGTTCFFERLGWIFRSFYFSNYNPLHRIGYWIQLSLWGLDARGYHWVSILLHFANTALAYVLARRLGIGRRAALFAAVLFGVHPTRAEVVAWISAQKDLGSGSFALASLCVYAPIVTGAARPSAARLGAVAALFAAALLTKPAAVAFPLLLLALDLAWRRPLVRSLLEKLPFFAIAAVFAAIAVQAGSRPGPKDGSWAVHAATVLEAPLFYLRRVFWPWDFSARWWVPRLPSVLAPAPLAGLAAIGAAFALVALGLRARDRRPAVLGIAWPALFLLPVSNIVPIPIVVTDRYLYLPLLGPILAAAALWGALRARIGGQAATAGRWAVAALAVAFAFFARAHCGAFRDTETLWRESLATQPENPVVRLYLASAILRSPSASARAHEVLDLMSAPEDWARGREQYFVTRAAAYAALGRAEDARREVERAVEIGRAAGMRFETAAAWARELVREGKYAEAHAALDAARVRDRGEKEIILRGHLEVAAEAKDDAGFLLWSARLLSGDPFDLGLLYGRSVAASRMGDAREAARSEARLDALLPGWRRLAAAREPAGPSGVRP